VSGAPRRRRKRGGQVGEEPGAYGSEADPGEGHRQRLRERFLQSGFKGFADHEKVVLLLTLCILRLDVKGAAKELLARFGNVRGVLDAAPEELCEVEGIGSVTPVALQIIREAATLYLQESAMEGQLLDSTSALADLFRVRLGPLKHEVFEVAYLDKSYRLIRNGIERLEEGLADRTRVYPSKVMRAALQKHAVYIVVAHNHPSGQLAPSAEDIQLTRSLQHAAKALDLHLLEHVIVTAEGSYSFADAGLL